MTTKFVKIIYASINLIASLQFAKTVHAAETCIVLNRKSADEFNAQVTNEKTQKRVMLNFVRSL